MSTLRQAYSLTSSLLFYLAPIILISSSYALISRKMRSRMVHRKNAKKPSKPVIGLSDQVIGVKETKCKAFAKVDEGFSKYFNNKSIKWIIPAIQNNKVDTVCNNKEDVDVEKFLNDRNDMRLKSSNKVVKLLENQFKKREKSASTEIANISTLKSPATSSVPINFTITSTSTKTSASSTPVITTLRLKPDPDTISQNPKTTTKITNNFTTSITSNCSSTDTFTAPLLSQTSQQTPHRANNKATGSESGEATRVVNIEDFNVEKGDKQHLNEMTTSGCVMKKTGEEDLFKTTTNPPNYSISHSTTHFPGHPTTHSTTHPTTHPFVHPISYHDIHHTIHHEGNFSKQPSPIQYHSTTQIVVPYNSGFAGFVQKFKKRKEKCNVEEKKKEKRNKRKEKVKRERKEKAHESVSCKKGQKSKERRTNRLLASISIVFTVSWLPFNILNVLSDFESEVLHEVNQKTHNLLSTFCFLLVLLSACLNPLLYGWLNDNFKKEFKSLLCRKAVINAASR